MFLPKASVCLSLITALAVPLALAQKPVNPGPPNAGPPVNSRPPDVNPRPSIPSRQPTSVPREPRKLVFLTGRVLFDDGTVPTEPVNVDRVCDRRTWREGHTDSSGHFSIQLGQSMEISPDASTGGVIGIPSPGSQGVAGASTGDVMGSPSPGSQGVTERELGGCELRASYPGALSDSLPLAGRHAMDDPNVGTIFLHRIGKVEGTKVSVTSLQAPKEAKKAFEHAKKAAGKLKWPEAQHDLEKAVAVYPTYAEAWSMLGITYNELHRPADAAHAFERALEGDSKYMEPYFHLAKMAAGDQNWARLAELTDRALTLDAYEYPALYFYNALANWYLSKVDAAEKSARTARRLDSQYRIPKIDLVLTMIFLQRQDYTAAAQQLREYLKHNPTGSEADQARAKLAEVERHMAIAEKK